MNRPPVKVRFIGVMIGFVLLAGSASITLDEPFRWFVLLILGFFAMRTWVDYRASRWQGPVALAGLGVLAVLGSRTLEPEARWFVLAIVALLAMRVWVGYRAKRWEEPKE